MVIKEIRFPTDIAYGSKGGPGYSTVISQTASGYESAILNWSKSRHRYNVAYGERTQAQLEAVLAFFHAVRGRGYGFRFKDWADYKSCADSATPTATDQAIGTGNGATATFQLYKLYSYGGETYSRPITKPVSGTVKVAVAGVAKTITTHFTVSTVTGIVTFTAGNIPTTGQAITAGYEFDVPARFDSDILSVSLDDWKLGAVDLDIVEVRV